MARFEPHQTRLPFTVSPHSLHYWCCSSILATLTRVAETLPCQLAEEQACCFADYSCCQLPLRGEVLFDHLIIHVYQTAMPIYQCCRHYRLAHAAAGRNTSRLNTGLLLTVLLLGKRCHLLLHLNSCIAGCFTGWQLRSAPYLCNQQAMTATLAAAGAGGSGSGSSSRVVLDGVLPAAICSELIMVARALSVVGYRDAVCSATIFEVAAAAPALLVPLVRFAWPCLHCLYLLPPSCVMLPAVCLTAPASFCLLPALGKSVMQCVAPGARPSALHKLHQLHAVPPLLWPRASNAAIEFSCPPARPPARSPACWAPCPQVAAREAVRAAVEEALGLDLGLLVEFTGLICWRPGSSIGWHHDANRWGMGRVRHGDVNSMWGGLKAGATILLFIM